MVKLSDFDYTLPVEAIASEPARPRSSARLLDMRGGGLSDKKISDLPQCLSSGDVLVVNNTEVIPARLIGMRSAAKVSVTLHQQASEDTWHCFAKPAKKLRSGDEIIFRDGLKAKVIALGSDGERTLQFNCGGQSLMALFDKIGSMPLPPYIPRPQGACEADKNDYQTIYASQKGAVAAPTAGLHFTEKLLGEIKAKGVAVAEITLHVGAGTFLPVKTDDPRKHKMHSEWGRIPHEVASLINSAKKRSNKIIAVGTTTLRILESCYAEHGSIKAYEGETSLFILPGFRFGVVDLLMTNFHLPKSTLLMLVCAFAGKTQIEAAYAHALNNNYRFFSYGDACLMERNHA